MPRSPVSPRYEALLAERKGALRVQFDQILRPETPFVWEIGCGHGHFLAAYAAAHPERQCIGIDLATERIDRALRKRDRAELSNLHFIQAEARVFFDALPSDVRFSAVFVLFPDPWPKSRHAKHRLLQPGFLSAIAGRALPTARLYFRTDFAPYFQEVAAALARRPGWDRVEEAWPFEFETVFQSRAPAFQSLVARPLSSIH